MPSPGEQSTYVVPLRYWAWLGTPRAVGALLWLAAAGVGAFFLWHALVWFNDSRKLPDERKRADGNGGHVQIDFGGQWVMGRMVVTGHARELYHRQRQWEVVRAAFPVEDETPVAREDALRPGSERKWAKPDETVRHDTDNLMYWFMGRDPTEWRDVGGASVAALGPDLFGNPLLTAAQVGFAADVVKPEVVAKVSAPAVGGPLYPPVHAFLYAPLGLIERPRVAYQVFQVIAVLTVLMAARGVTVLSRGRVPWPVATAALFLFPGTRAGLDLGQNPTLTLAIAVWGWALASRGYAAAGGAVWGLFAFKPVWGLAFFLVPVLTRRWRFCAAMVLTGCGLAAATVPFVGVHTWLDWLTVGREAAELYNVNQNWINLSRDVQGVPRRVLHDFSLPEAERDTPLAKYLAWSLWGAILATTVVVFVKRGDRTRWTGIGIAFLFFGAYLTCYRFMYYDALLAAAGCACLLADPARLLRTPAFGLALAPAPPFAAARALPVPTLERGALGPRAIGYVSSVPLTLVALLVVYENAVSGMELQGTLGFGYYARVATGADGATAVATPQVRVDTGVNYPWETALVFILWLWCGWALLRGAEAPAPAAAPG
ncbi:glycosyltransferase family 87 protein [Gemmata sp.]|uniref:glycosyltransferase family 87 protein n=1 Tax=Gemmata sp. TaxID=1914242 RepID=UPI003F7019E3